MKYRSRLSSRARYPLGALAACLLGLVVAACDSGDSLEAIRARQESGDLAGTVEPLRELLGADPTNAEVSYLYGRALVSTGQPFARSLVVRLFSK